MKFENIQKVKTLILDAGPIIKLGTRVKDYAEEFITVPEVLREIRDRQARQQLALFPFDILVRVPSEEAFKAVIAFSKKTGDFAALSGVDLKVLALTYMIEKEKCGIDHIRTEPAKAQVQLGSQQPKVQKESTPDSKKTSALPTDSQVSIPDSKISPEATSKSLDKSSDDALAKELENLTVSDEVCSSDETNPSEIEDDAEDSDDGEWITPQNLKKKQLESLGHLKEGEDKVEARKVGCITTDYAMQSVILQMNLALVSVEGMMIRNLRSFVLRCHACFKVTTNLTKQFCPSCGGPTLIRTSCSVDESGEVKYYLKKNFRYNLRGTKYSIPNPKGGHINTDLILREDTKEYERAMKNYAHRKETDLFDPDYLPGILTGKHIGNNRPPTIGYGRKNPNQARRCKGRKKS